MSLQACYAALEGNYDDVIGRLRTERLVQKFVLKFLNDPSFSNLCSSLEAKDYEEAFRAAHTIKGVCQNLSFTKLYQSSQELTEALRDGYRPEVDSLFSQVTADYQQTADAIRAFQAEVEGK